MDQGGPTDTREAYFKEASEEMIRARTLCAKANAVLPDDPSYMTYLEELFVRDLSDVRILTPFLCDFGNRIKFGKGVFLNHSAILSASGGIEFEDGVLVAPGVRIATINHGMNRRHTTYTYGKVTIRKNAWIGMNVTIGRYAVVAAGAVVTKDIRITRWQAACPPRYSAIWTRPSSRNNSFAPGKIFRPRLLT